MHPESAHLEASPALDATTRWARRYLITRRAFLSAVTDTAEETQEFVRVRRRGTTRRIVPRTVPTESRSRKVEPPLDPNRFDPWAVEATTLRAASHQLVTCPTCSGDKKVTCRACAGSATVTCPFCRGGGSARSNRTGKLINCPSCRGKGVRRCACRNGTTRCETCEGRGRVERWLELQQEPFLRVTTTASNRVSGAFPQPSEPADFDRPQAWPVAPTATWTGAADADVPEPIAMVLLRRDLGCHLSPREDRVETIDVQVFRAPVTTVAYRLAGTEGIVDVQGWDSTVKTTPTSCRPFHNRFILLAAAAAIALLLGIAVAALYVERHPYYATTSQASLLWLLAPVIGLATVPPTAILALPRGTAPRRRLAAAAAPLICLLLATTALATTGNPSLAHARARLSAGDLDAALFESAASAELGLDTAAPSFHDEHQLARAEATTMPAEAWQAAARVFFTDEARHAAETHALRLTVEAAEAHQQQHAYTNSEAVLALVPDHLAGDDALRPLRLAIHLARAGTCIDRLAAPCARDELRRARAAGFTDEELAPLHQRAADAVRPSLLETWSTIRAHRPLDDRLAACIDAQLGFVFLEKIGTPEALYPIREADLDARCGLLQEQRRREEELARQRELQRREAAQRAWARAPLLCRDGTYSPSCACGRTSRSGCCSHHGGVAGCSASYPG